MELEPLSRDCTRQDVDPLTRLALCVSDDPCKKMCEIAQEAGRLQCEKDLKISCLPCDSHDNTNTGGCNIQS